MCVLLVVLWVRSYSQVALVLCKFGNGTLTVVQSWPGGIVLAGAHEETVEPWYIFRAPTEEWLKRGGARQLERTWGGFLVSNGAIATPYWFWVLLTTTLAGIPWLLTWESRFSLRRLLIATTLIAVVLGTVAALRFW